MKNNDSTKAIQTVALGKQLMDADKRKLIKWLPPVVAAFSLPAHAMCTDVVPNLVATAAVPSKCSGPANALVGEASITLTSDSGPIEITAISHNAPGTDTITPPGLPATVTSTSGVDVGWQGPGSDAIICLPLNTITLTVSNSCDSTYTINLTDVLAAAVS